MGGQRDRIGQGLIKVALECCKRSGELVGGPLPYSVARTLGYGRVMRSGGISLTRLRRA
jgi:hypothetical protein